MKRIFIITIVVAMALCFTVSMALAGNPIPKKVGLCMPEAATDKGWNEQAAIGLKVIAEKYGFEMVLAEALGYGDIKPTMRDLIKKGCKLIITHASGYQTVAPEIAHETGVMVTTIENEKAQAPGLINDIDTEGGPGAYLAGVLAGRMTRTNIVGIVVSGEPPTWNRMSAGFAQGLKASNPDCKLLYSVIGEAAYADAAGAKRNTDDQIAIGADVIFGQGDGASFGMLQSCSANKAKDGGKAWFIDVIGDKRSIDKADVLLSSVLFDYSVAYDEVIKRIVNGTFGDDTIWVSVPAGSIYLMEPNKAVPQEVRDEIESIRQKIAAGEVAVVDIPVAGDLHKYFNELFPK